LAESSTDDALTTTFLDGASITFTPDSASDWLVLTNGQYNPSADSVSYISRMDRSGEDSSVLPEARREMASGGQPTRVQQVSLARVFSLGAVSNTFKEQGAETATNVTRLHSRVFALNLNKFRNHAFSYTESDAALSATNYATQLETISITPDVTGDVWVGGYFGFDAGNASRIVEYRIQRDDSDEPAGQTTANYQFKAGGDATDEMAVLTQCFPSLTAATPYVIDLDASSDSTTGTPAGQHTSLWAVTMELAVAAAPSDILLHMLAYH
jgi:hypothetical protein